jgi:transposase
MMGPKQEAQAALCYEFSLEDHVPQDHLLRSIDRFADLSSIRGFMADFYSHTGRPSIDPEVLIYYPVVHVYMHERADAVGGILLWHSF